MNKEVLGLKNFIENVQWQDDSSYAQWLSQAYYIAKRSTSFLGLCLFHSDNYPEFQKRCGEHIAEETGHEKLILNDIKRLGYSLQPELPATMSIYQPQYFRIVAENPLSFIGYVFFLELLAPAFGEYVMNRVSNKSALSFLKVHTSADEDHLESATNIWETLPQNIREMAFSNFKMTESSYQRMLVEITGLNQVKKVA